jgi:protein O-mannosyl-transferase
MSSAVKSPKAAKLAEARPPAAESGRAGIGSMSAHPRLLLAGLILVTAAVYLRSLGDGFVFDDVELIVDNRYMAQWSFLWKSFVYDFFWVRDPFALPQSLVYRPLTDVWFTLHRHLLIGPAGWHATLVLVHLVAVWLVFELAFRLAGDFWSAMLAASLFALTPVHAEAVVWISAAALPLSAALELGALYIVATRTSPARRHSIGALLLYLAAVFSYDGAIIFPALVGSYVLLLESPAEATVADCFQWPRIREAVLAATPFALEGLLYLAVRRIVLGFFLSPLASMAYTPNTQALTNSAEVLLTLPHVAADYAGLLIAPFYAGPSHRVLRVLSPASPEFYWPLVWLGLGGAALFLLLRGSPRARLYAFCAAWTAVAIVPMMNLRGIHPDLLVCDRYLYLASAGWSMLVADWAVGVARRSGPARQIVTLGAAALLAGFAVSLWHIQGFWRDDVVLFTRCIDTFPESAICHGHLGLTLKQRGDLSGARVELEKAISLDEISSAPGYYALGQVDAKLGRIAPATVEIERALAQMAGSFGHYRGLGKKSTPAPANAYTLLAELYDQQGQSDKSRALLKYTESLPEGLEAAWMAQSQIDWRHGDTGSAQATLSNLVQRFPEDPRVWVMQGLAMKDQGRNQEAFTAFEHAISIDPYDPKSHLFLAQALHAEGRNQEALQQCRIALSSSPDDASVRALASEVQRELGQN